MKPANKVTSQKGTGGSSMPQRNSTGSGSRPTAGSIKIPSSNPVNAQKLRG